MAKYNQRSLHCISLIALLAAWGISGCAHTATSYSRQENSELREHKHVKKLIVSAVPGDDRRSAFYRIKVAEDAEIQRAVRTIAEVTVKEYPFSGARKIDEVFIGIVGAPFMPLAFIGGLANNEPDLIFFPLSAWNPFANFRPGKGGIFSGPISPRYQQHTEKGEWKYLSPTKTVQPYASGNLLIEANGRSLRLATDQHGVAVIDCNRLGIVPGASSDIRLTIRTSHDMVCMHNIPATRLAAILPAKTARPQAMPPAVLPKPRSSQPLVNKPQSALAKVTRRAVQPSRQLAISSLMPSLPKAKAGEVLLYKTERYGYWVSSEGIAVLALPAREGAQLYADEYLRYLVKKELGASKAYYVFAFTFDPITHITLAAKIGTSPREEESVGWISAQDIVLWQTLYLLADTNPLTLFPSYESCRQGNSRTALTYKGESNTPMPALPVIEQRENAWCVAYPDVQNQGKTLSFGWLAWNNSLASQLQVRVMKHKLDAAIQFLENKIILGDKQTSNSFALELHGPLSLQQVTGEMFLASFNKGKEDKQSIQGQFLDIPNGAAYDEFQETILRISNELLKKNLWEGDDVVYLPVD